jgi:hypothetical protein
MTESDLAGTNVGHSSPGRGTLRPVSLEGEPARGGVAAPASPITSEAEEPAPARSGVESAPAPARPDPTRGVVDGTSIADLESEVYTVRDVNGEELDELRRTLSQARSEMSEATYRRALVLARDSALLSLEECINGALAMEWEPAPRPEFSLETIEAAVAEQERNGQGAADEPAGRTA